MSLFADPHQYPELYASDDIDDECVADCGHSLCEDRREWEVERRSGRTTVVIETLSAQALVARDSELRRMQELAVEAMRTPLLPSRPTDLTPTLAEVEEDAIPELVRDEPVTGAYRVPTELRR